MSKQSRRRPSTRSSSTTAASNYAVDLHTRLRPAGQGWASLTPALAAFALRLLEDSCWLRFDSPNSIQWESIPTSGKTMAEAVNKLLPSIEESLKPCIADMLPGSTPVLEPLAYNVWIPSGPHGHIGRSQARYRKGASKPSPIVIGSDISTCDGPVRVEAEVFVVFVIHHQAAAATRSLRRS